MLKKFFVFTFLIQGLPGYAQVNPAIIKGRIPGPFAWKSSIYPGTERNYWLYVPKQYDASKPACVLVLQDGLSRANGWNLPAVLDTLIATKEIPVMIGIFIEPGRTLAADTTNYPRFNRSFEYDAMGDRYARLLMEEILPEVSRSYNLSTDPNDRLIAGASSGAICAFNVAWERPDAFRRVFSSIGTYVGLRGAHEFATLTRKTEPKPLRVFLQDGSQDNNSYAGDWWMANQNMLSALTWAGYEVNHAWGEGGHDAKHTITILADALRWIWKDYPAAIRTHPDTSKRFIPVIAGEEWKEIALKNVKPGKLAVNKTGALFFADHQAVYTIDDKGSTTLFTRVKGKIGGLSFHSDGRLYVADLDHHAIIAIDERTGVQNIVMNTHADYLLLSDKGIYFSETAKNRIGFYSFLKKNVQYVQLDGEPTGLAISAEQTFLNVGLLNSVFGYSYKIETDGRLAFGQEYIHYHIPYGVNAAGTRAMIADTANLLYSATAMGIQVSEQLGKVNFIFSKPADGALDVKLGGENFNVLYMNCNGRIFRRKINTRGTLSWLPPVKPPRPRM